MAQAPKKAAQSATPDLGEDDVVVEVLSTIEHDGKAYGPGDSLTLPAKSAKALIDAAAARPGVA